MNNCNLGAKIHKIHQTEKFFIVFLHQTEKFQLSIMHQIEFFTTNGCEFLLNIISIS